MINYTVITVKLYSIINNKKLFKPHNDKNNLKCFIGFLFYYYKYCL